MKGYRIPSMYPRGPTRNAPGNFLGSWLIGAYKLRFSRDFPFALAVSKIKSPRHLRNLRIQELADFLGCHGHRPGRALCQESAYSGSLPKCSALSWTAPGSPILSTVCVSNAFADATHAVFIRTWRYRVRIIGKM